MFGLHIADIVTLGIYLLGVTVIGVLAARRVKNASDFIMPRRFGKWMMMMHGFGTATHSDQAVSVASKSFTNGLSGIWYQWMWLFATPFFWLIAPMMRRFRALTTGDVFRARFDQSVASLYAILGLGKFMVNIALMLQGSAIIIDAVSGGSLPEKPVIFVITILFVIYGIAGGLNAAIVTDVIQGILTIAFSFLLLPLAMHAVGGLSGLKESLAELRPGENMMSLVVPGGIGVFYIFMISLNSLLGVVVQPHNMGTCAAGKTEMEGAVGFMGGTMIKRVCTVAWCLTALAAVAYFQDQNLDPDRIFGHMAREFLPAVMPGLLGLFLASLLATVMGSCDSFMVASSGLVTQNLYKPVVRGKSDAHYLKVARFTSLIVVVGGVYLAYQSESVVKMLENLWKINTMMAMAFWLGIFWRRTTVAGAWAATIAAVSIWWITEQGWFTAWLAQWIDPESSSILRVKEGVISVFLPWQMVFYIVGGFAAGILVSLFTRPISEDRLERFYGLLRTPVTPGETVDEPCTLPKGVSAGPRRVLFPNTNLEIPQPAAKAFHGFWIGWAMVLAIIGVVWLWIAN